MSRLWFIKIINELNVKLTFKKKRSIQILERNANDSNCAVGTILIFNSEHDASVIEREKQDK